MALEEVLPCFGVLAKSTEYRQRHSVDSVISPRFDY